MSWQPVLEGEDRERALGSIEAIAGALEKGAPTHRSRAALTDGLPGMALFFAYLDRAAPEKGHAETAVRLLDEALDDSEAIAASAGLFEGTTGLCWTLQHLALLADPPLAELDEFDQSVADALAGAPRPTEVDLMGGLCGLGVLAFERAGASRIPLERLVRWLDATADVTPAGITWRTPPQKLHPKTREEFPAGCFQVGVAHGVAGLIVLLAGLYEAGVERPTVSRLLEGAVAWLLAQELPGDLALFPTVLDEHRSRPASRSAWCWGGPGISSALRIAAQVAGEPAWRAKAVALARAAARRPLEQAGVKDACFCHGSAGLGHIYNRWYQATGDDFFRDEARTWFRRALDHQKEGQGIAGYSMFDATVEGDPWRPMPGILLGAAGVGLALISAAAPVEPAWDRLFLLSLRR